MAEVKNIIKNESRINQSVELLEHINRRVTELSCPERNPGKHHLVPSLVYLIDLHWDTKNLLSSKVEVAKELKADFQSILDT